MTGTIEDLPRTSRSKTKTTEEKIEEVIDLLKNFLGLSLIRASKIISIRYGNAQNIAKEKMGLHPYKLKIAHKLKDPDFQNRIIIV